jgi:hypothetical protein
MRARTHALEMRGSEYPAPTQSILPPQGREMQSMFLTVALEFLVALFELRE